MGLYLNNSVHEPHLVDLDSSLHLPDNWHLVLRRDGHVSCCLDGWHLVLKHHWHIHGHDDATEPYRSITAEPTLERLRSDTYTICLSLSKDNEFRTEYRKVQFRNVVLVGLKPARAFNVDT